MDTQSHVPYWNMPIVEMAHFIQDLSCNEGVCQHYHYPYECQYCNGIVHADLGEEIPIFDGLTTIFQIIEFCDLCYFRKIKE